MPSHFLLPMSAMAKGEWLKLVGQGAMAFLKFALRQYEFHGVDLSKQLL
jgi:hypothetical protein